MRGGAADRMPSERVLTAVPMDTVTGVRNEQRPPVEGQRQERKQSMKSQDQEMA